MKVSPIPQNVPRIIPYLIVEEIERTVQFILDSFGGDLTEGIEGPDGKMMHAELRIGEGMIMMGRSSEEYPPFPAMLYIYHENCDEAYRKAMEAGAESIMEPSDQFYGDRNAGVQDLDGNVWYIATHVEDVSSEELEKRSQEAWAARNGEN